MATPLQKNPYTGGHEICNFGSPFIGHHYCILSVPQNYHPFGWGWGHEINKFLSPYPKYATCLIWLRLVQYVLKRRCKRTTHDGRRRTQAHSNRSP